MKYRGLVDKKGELFAYVQGDQVYTLDYELTGRIKGDVVVDLGGKPVWRVFGDGVYTLDGVEPVGFLSSEGPEEW
jgi:hypothetical protein